MTPIEKARARSAALAVLGLGLHADADEIRQAWKRRAYATHPDRAQGTDDAFVQAKSAFDFLTGAASDFAMIQPVRPATATRPRPQQTHQASELTEAEQAACRDRLAADGDGAGDGNGHGDHVPFAQIRAGRDLTFLVGGSMAEGVNRVALPSTALGGRRARPVIARLRPLRAGSGDVLLPDDMRARLFPGARSVRIRFGQRAEAA